MQYSLEFNRKIRKSRKEPDAVRFFFNACPLTTNLQKTYTPWLSTFTALISTQNSLLKHSSQHICRHSSGPQLDSEICISRQPSTPHSPYRYPIEIELDILFIFPIYCASGLSIERA